MGPIIGTIYSRTIFAILSSGSMPACGVTCQWWCWQGVCISPGILVQSDSWTRPTDHLQLYCQSTQRKLPGYCKWRITTSEGVSGILTINRSLNITMVTIWLTIVMRKHAPRLPKPEAMQTCRLSASCLWSPLICCNTLKLMSNRILRTWALSTVSINKGVYHSAYIWQMTAIDTSAWLIK